MVTRGRRGPDTQASGSSPGEKLRPHLFGIQSLGLLDSASGPTLVLGGLGPTTDFDNSLRVQALRYCLPSRLSELL